MSGLEPLAAFGLACGVFQTISFTREFYKTCDKFFHGEAPGANITDEFNHLLGFFEDITAAKSVAARPLTKNDLDILDVAESCKATAQELKADVSKLSDGAAKGSGWRAMKRGVKYQLKLKSKIVALDEKLKQQESVFRTRQLGIICNQVDAMAIRQTQEFSMLDAGFRRFIAAIADGEAHLAAVIAREAASTKQHVTAEIHNLRTTIFDEAKHEKLLRSIKYDSMNQRRNQIMDPAANTFKWIFDEAEENHQGGQASDEATLGNFVYKQCILARKTASADFIDWLRSSDQDVFWISGKAGSGKSTFMKFLATHPNTCTNLNMSGKQFLILSHFIWSAGQAMERQIKGVICSFLYQLLELVPNTGREVLAEYPNAMSKDNAADWSEKELDTVFRFAVEKSGNKGICIFVDGLDEIDHGLTDGQKRLLEVLEGLRALSPIKICVASRPEPILKNRLSQAPMFELHKVTQWDIWRFATTVFDQRFPHLYKANNTDFLRRVCWMAEGVFLWVALALRSLEMGIEKGDDVTRLYARLDKLPLGLKGLYAEMFSRSGDEQGIYREDAAKYITFALIHGDFAKMAEHGGFSLRAVDLLLAKNQGLVKKFQLGQLKLSSLAETVYNGLESLQRHIEACCGGMLEFRRGDGHLMHSDVTFIHRSAVEFFQDPHEGQQLLKFDPVSRSQRLIELAKGLLMSELVMQELGKQIPYLRLTPSDFLGMVQALLYHYTDGNIPLDELFAITSFVEGIFGAWPTSWDIRFWPKPPWADFLGAAAAAGMFHVVQKGLQRLESSGTVSKEYNTYLLTAAISGSDDFNTVNSGELLVREGPIPPMRLKTIHLLLERDIQPDFRSLDFSRQHDWEFGYHAVAYHMSPLDTAIRRFVARTRRHGVSETAMAAVINKLLDQGPDLSQRIVFRLRINDYQDMEVLGTSYFGTPDKPYPYQTLLYVEANIATLVNIMGRTIDVSDALLDDSVKGLAKRTKAFEQQWKITRIVYYPWGISVRNGYSIGVESEYFEPLVKCIEIMFMARSCEIDYSHKPIPSFRAIGLPEVLRHILQFVSPISKKSHLQCLVDEGLAFKWDDERAFRPRRYANVDEPVDEFQISDQICIGREARKRWETLSSFNKDWL